jgi:hypothetical protein
MFQLTTTIFDWKINAEVPDDLSRPSGFRHGSVVRMLAFAGGLRYEAL